MEILRFIPDEITHKEDYRKIKIPPIFFDNTYIECLKLAEQSKTNLERYGSKLIKNNRTFGQGYNRAISHPAFKLKRIIHQGYHNHAEGEAI